MPDKNHTIITQQQNLDCFTITFEGLDLGDKQPIPPIDAGFTVATFPNWLSLLPQSEGGTGNIANLPSPITVAFFQGDGNSRDILFTNPVSRVSLMYASTVPVTLEAFDANGNLIDSASAPANFGGQVLDTWDPITVDAGANVITRVTFTGEESNSPIDNVELCRIKEAGRGIPFEKLQ